MNISDAGVAAVAADAAEEAAEAAELAADVAAVAAADPQPDPNVLVHAEVDLARLETEENLARIAARTETRIAELNAEEPPWLAEHRACLQRIEATLAVIAATQSTPAPSAVAIAEPAPAPASVSEPAAVESIGSAEVTPVQPDQNPAPAPAPQAPRKSRWI